MTELSDVRQALALLREPLIDPQPSPRAAAVAVVLQLAERELELLFIRRSEREGDPWSGQIAFPGGHVNEQDASLPAAAERETLEETGLCLKNAEFLGVLGTQRTSRRREAHNLNVVPCVYALAEQPEFSLNHEVAEVIWTPLRCLADEKALGDAEVMWEGRMATFPGCRIGEGHLVWGLTYRIVRELLAKIDVGSRVRSRVSGRREAGSIV